MACPVTPGGRSAPFQKTTAQTRLNLPPETPPRKEPPLLAPKFRTSKLPPRKSGTSLAPANCRPSSLKPKASDKSAPAAGTKTLSKARGYKASADACPPPARPPVKPAPVSRLGRLAPPSKSKLAVKQKSPEKQISPERCQTPIICQTPIREKTPVKIKTPTPPPPPRREPEVLQIYIPSQDYVLAAKAKAIELVVDYGEDQQFSKFQDKICDIPALDVEDIQNLSYLDDADCEDIGAASFNVIDDCDISGIQLEPDRRPIAVDEPCDMMVSLGHSPLKPAQITPARPIRDPYLCEKAFAPISPEVQANLISPAKVCTLKQTTPSRFKTPVPLIPSPKQRTPSPKRRTPIVPRSPSPKMATPQKTCPELLDAPIQDDCLPSPIKSPTKLGLTGIKRAAQSSPTAISDYKQSFTLAQIKKLKRKAKEADRLKKINEAECVQRLEDDAKELEKEAKERERCKLKAAVFKVPLTKVENELLKGILPWQRNIKPRRLFQPIPQEPSSPIRPPVYDFNPKPKPITPPPKPRTPSPKQKTPSPKPRTPSPKPRTPTPKPRTPSPKQKTPPAPEPVYEEPPSCDDDDDEVRFKEPPFLTELQKTDEAKALAALGVNINLPLGEIANYFIGIKKKTAEGFKLVDVLAMKKAMLAPKPVEPVEKKPTRVSISRRTVVPTKASAASKLTKPAAPKAAPKPPPSLVPEPKKSANQLIRERKAAQKVAAEKSAPKPPRSELEVMEACVTLTEEQKEKKQAILAARADRYLTKADKKFLVERFVEQAQKRENELRNNECLFNRKEAGENGDNGD